MNGSAYLADTIQRLHGLKHECDRAIAQVPFEAWSRRLDAGSNSIVTLMLHLSGNMLSRWPDFLTTDGEKPGRDRDAEFEDAPGLAREALLARWDQGWAALFAALEPLTEADLERSITIRGQPLPVVSAIQRQLAHYAGHTGQIVLLAKHLAGPAWVTLSVPRGGSKAHDAAMARRFGGGSPPA
jgi:hypothetical protein